MQAIYQHVRARPENDASYNCITFFTRTSDIQNHLGLLFRHLNKKYFTQLNPPLFLLVDLCLCRLRNLSSVGRFGKAIKTQKLVLGRISGQEQGWDLVCLKIKNK
jgi:hypothetical protein